MGEKSFKNIRQGEHPAIPIVGFGLLLAWTYVVFFSRLVHFSTRNSIEHLNSTYSFACCGIIAALVFYALPWDRLLRRPPTPQASCRRSHHRCLRPHPSPSAYAPSCLPSWNTTTSASLGAP